MKKIFALTVATGFIACGPTPEKFIEKSQQALARELVQARQARAELGRGVVAQGGL